nr:hypothetical protein [Bradyrhizobium sp. ARR65]
MTTPKLLSAGLIVAAVFASLAIARESSAKARSTAVHSYAAVQRTPAAYKRTCVRAPDVGAFATRPWRKPPCEPGSGF